jgi:hypothetical protein
MGKDAKEMDLDELAQQMNLRPDSMAHLAAHAEFIRRQTEAQLEAAHAQIVAAQATPPSRRSPSCRKISKPCATRV